MSAPTPVPVLHKQEQTAPYKSLLLIINQFTLTLQKIISDINNIALRFEALAQRPLAVIYSL